MIVVVIKINCFILQKIKFYPSNANIMKKNYNRDIFKSTFIKIS